MKKIILVFISLIFIYVIIYNSKTILIKYFLGTARIVNKELKYEVKVNGKVNSNCRIFNVTQSFNKKWNCNILVLYFNNDSNNSLLIDLNNKDVGIPNAGNDDYDIIFGNLFQSESGSFYVSFNDKAKSYGFDTELEIYKDSILFKLPSWSKEKINTIQLIKI